MLLGLDEEEVKFLEECKQKELEAEDQRCAALIHAWFRLFVCACLCLCLFVCACVCLCL